MWKVFRHFFSFDSLSLWLLGAETEIQIPGLFINPEGYIALYQKIADSTSKSNWFWKFWNNIVPLPPQMSWITFPSWNLPPSHRSSSTASYGHSERKMKKVTAGSLSATPPLLLYIKPIEGKIKSLTGVKGDIHHLCWISKDSILKEGFVFNNNGICLGFISNQQTDIYSLFRILSEHPRSLVKNGISLSSG